MPKGMNDMLWGVIKVDIVVPGDWLLLDQSIQDRPCEAIEAIEDALGETWDDLRASGFYMVRLRRMPDGQPADITFAWTEKEWVKATGVMTYAEYIARDGP